LGYSINSGGVWTFAFASGWPPNKKIGTFLIFTSFTFTCVRIPNSSDRTVRYNIFANTFAVFRIPIMNWAAIFDLIALALTQFVVPVLIVGADL